MPVSGGNSFTNVTVGASGVFGTIENITMYSGLTITAKESGGQPVEVRVRAGPTPETVAFVTGFPLGPNKRRVERLAATDNYLQVQLSLPPSASADATVSVTTHYDNQTFNVNDGHFDFNETLLTVAPGTNVATGPTIDTRNAKTLCMIVGDTQSNLTGNITVQVSNTGLDQDIAWNTLLLHPLTANVPAVIEIVHVQFMFYRVVVNGDVPFSGLLFVSSSR